MFIDSHCHLDSEDYSGEIDSIVQRAKDAGINAMLTIGTHITKAHESIEIAEKFDNVYCSIGIHPHFAESEPEVTVEELVELAKHPKVIGIGETGLDYYYDSSPRDIQQKSFRTHIKAARQAGLPVIVHTRSADKDTIKILKDEYSNGAFSGVIHCFTSGEELAVRALELGFYISASGIITFKKSDELRDVLSMIPLDRLLLETDAPWLAPTPYRGKRNEPSYIVHVASVLAKLKGVTVDDIGKATTKNFLNLFKVKLK